jgi:hypothetical protein
MTCLLHFKYNCFSKSYIISSWTSLHSRYLILRPTTDARVIFIISEERCCHVWIQDGFVTHIHTLMFCFIMCCLQIKACSIVCRLCYLHTHSHIYTESIKVRRITLHVSAHFYYKREFGESLILCLQ